MITTMSHAARRLVVAIAIVAAATAGTATAANRADRPPRIQYMVLSTFDSIQGGAHRDESRKYRGTARIAANVRVTKSAGNVPAI